jgi:aerobic-type carbon monoxide dehydrogenase small subunit (CoxS/CutS family)
MTMSGEQSSVDVVVDGQPCALAVRGDETLLETLRERCGATSVRYCCGIGVCGTCTVLLDGAPVSSCLLLTVMVAGRQVVTPEGLPPEDGAGVSAAQQAFVDAGAFQCSYCIPAMALTVQAAVDRDPAASVEGVCEELGGNLCRCGSYPQVRAAVVAVISARLRRQQATEVRGAGR